ncbi:alpha/beta-hydrolase [Cristinia sonorae]|uniref:Alpha/beta-hydrolase n=1 Tax=Cristinia sonorae TaxID=1940300 RepID=A0A8K0XT96_9AGAR|nr:alpha/beta-hydrolase [Cristinia sonorae]
MPTPEDCKDCVIGNRHEGEPQGKIEKIGGYDCYVATPSGDYSKDKVVLFLTDVFGLKFNNNLLLADDFARNGYKTIAPDILVGDPLTDTAHQDPKFDFDAWRAKHGEDTWIPVVDAVVQSLKSEFGITRIGTTGYCFGAPPAFRLAFQNESHVTVLAHPSRLKVPEDFEKYREVSKAPLLINACEVDKQFPLESQAIADEILGGGKFAPGYQKAYWDGCVHSFAVRGDMNIPKVKAGKEGAFEASVRFFNKYL